MFSRLGRFFSFPFYQDEIELAKLTWVVHLRWGALILFFGLTAPALVWGYLNSQTVSLFIATLGLIFLFNLFTHLLFLGPRKNPGRYFICFQLALDLMAFSTLVFFSGGLSNPFLILLLLNVAIGGLLISRKKGWPFLLLAHTLLGAMQLSYIQDHLEDMTSSQVQYNLIAHAVLFLFWFVTSSLGEYLESQHVAQMQARVHIERQDRLRTLGLLAAGFSHEFASPLTAAKMRIERIKRKFETDVNREDLNEALSSLKACEKIIYRMNSSQLDARDFNLKKINIKNFLTDILTSWKEENPQAHLHDQIKFDGELTLAPINFAQVILNLLDNARESSPLTPINFTFEKENQIYKMSIADEGKGFPPEIIQRRGEPFLTTKTNGTGLGLYITHLFAQSLGGELRMANRVRGAEVNLIWPSIPQGNDRS